MPIKSFNDHFSKQAQAYQAFRPGYPTELFAYLESITAANLLAWDCATGSGQAALGLTDFFDHIIATDASSTQIKNAVHHEKIKYTVSTVENTLIKNESIDLITIAQALHWFDTNAFFIEAKRVLRNKGIIAAWTYNLFQTEANFDDIINHFDKNIIGEFWPQERRLVDEAYASIKFPFKPIETPDFKMTGYWSLSQILGYLETWSAVQRFIQANKKNPLDLIVKELTSAWGDPAIKKEINWPLTLIAGRHEIN